MAVVPGHQSRHQAGVRQLLWVQVDTTSQSQAGAEEGQALLAAHCAASRRALLAPGSAGTPRRGAGRCGADNAARAPVARSHLMRRHRGVSVLCGDGERQVAPKDAFEEGVPTLGPPASGRGIADRLGEGTDVCSHCCLRQGRGFLSQVSACLFPWVPHCAGTRCGITSR